MENSPLKTILVLLDEENQKLVFWYECWLSDRAEGVPRKKSRAYSKYRKYKHSTNLLKRLYCGLTVSDDYEQERR